MKTTEVYIISLPIGNDEDISHRAKVLLQSAEILIGEESKFLSSFLKRIGIPRKFQLFNEHSTPEDLTELIHAMKSVETVAIVSDAGLPNLEDPGRKLIPALLDRSDFHLNFVPGASCLDAGLALAGFSTRPFLFLGLIPRDSDERKRELTKYLNLGMTLVILETPYRYKKLLEDISQVLGKSNPRRVFLGLNLTHPTEEYQFRGKISDLLKNMDSLPKAPPIILIESK
jgi:16S rRNA (cytidine1402-2'-O)-methyltransferase